MSKPHSHDRQDEALHPDELLQQTYELVLSGKDPREIADKIGPVKSKIDDCIEQINKDFCEYHYCFIGKEEADIYLLRSAISLLGTDHLLVRVAAVQSVRKVLDEHIEFEMEIERQIILAESDS